MVLFWFLYVLITQFPIPRTLLTLSSGIIFGPVLGIAVALSATAVSSGVSLVVVRFLLGDIVRPHLTHPAVTYTNTRLAQRGWLAVGSLRMIPAVPFSILNYVAAFTSVRFVPFVAATALGSTPGTCATVLIGDTLVAGAQPMSVGITGAFALCGLAGLWLDTKIPVQSRS